MKFLRQQKVFSSITNRKSESVEKYLFILFSLLNLLPLFLVKYTSSLDGPQHLYVSRVIGELWRSNELFEQFFKINDIIVGNWVGHFLLSVYHLFLPGWLAEKFLLATYLIGIAFSFRYLVISINNKSSFISFLIFPFSYTVLYHLGYYNYCFATAVMLFAFGYWLKIENKLNISKFFIFLLLLVLLYLSHFFVFVFFGASLVFYMLISFLSILLDKKNKKDLIRLNVKKIVFLVFASSASLILAYKYWISFSGYSAYLKLPFDELIINLYDIRSLIGFHTKIEGAENNMLFLLLCFLFIFAVVDRIVKRKNSKSNQDGSLFRYFNKNDFWLLLTFAFLALYLIVPDRLSAGNISNRLSILLFLFFITWLSAQKYPYLISFLTITIIIIYSINTRAYQHKSLDRASKAIAELKEIQEFIVPNSIVYSFNYMPSWRQLHFQYYACVDKPILNAAGPECNGNFPLIWNLEKRPAVYLGTTNLKNFCNYCSSTDVTLPKKTIEYVIIWGATNFHSIDKNDKVKVVLKNNYEKIHTSLLKRAELYKLKY
ncbi:MAG: hypothetical protein K8R86_06810 [Bacteroidales bacterium]|nr:hypothetical protein [Bacteroidales bacterium]